MDIPTRLTQQFEGAPLPFFNYKGQLATLLIQLGRRLGYARNGERLVTLVTDPKGWGPEFREGTHYLKMVGPELLAFKQVYGATTESVGASTTHLILLLEPGIHLVLLKTHKPIGVRLRDFLAREVMPQLMRSRLEVRRTESPQVALPFVLVPVTPAPANRPFVSEREGRLADQNDLRERKFQQQQLRDTARLLYRHGELDRQSWLAWEVRATEIAMGQELPGLRPVLEAWWSSNQIARRAGVSRDVVEQTIRRLELRNQPGTHRLVLSAVPDGRAVVTRVYSDATAEQILRNLASEPPEAA